MRIDDGLAESTRSWKGQRRRVIYSLLCAAGLYMAMPPLGNAQAFETMTLRIAAVQPLRQPLSEGWREGPGIAASAEMPFYAGLVEVGAQIHIHDRQSSEVPPLSSGLLYLGWSAPLNLSERIRVSAGPRLGMYVMHFDDDRLNPQAEVEQELAGHLIGRLDASLVGRWTAHVSATYGLVILSEPVRQSYVEAGIGFRFATPDWLREALR